MAENKAQIQDFQRAPNRINNYPDYIQTIENQQ
jgi:hypothetical protein